MTESVRTAGAAPTRLGEAHCGFAGVVQGIDIDSARSEQDKADLERRLVEFGFLEGTRVEILHEGAIAGDPIAVRVNNLTVALRRREAMAIVVGA
jgi:ferrous iron transport protein A